jgi:hypothetical protein
VWEEALTTFARALGEVSAYRDTSHASTDAAQRDFSTRVCTSSSQSR